MIRVAPKVFTTGTPGMRAIFHLTCVMHVARRVVRTVILERISAERAELHALIIAVMLAVALGVAAIAADVMRSTHIRLTLHGIYTRAVIRIHARRLMAAKAPVTPKQTAHAAGGVVVGTGADVGLTAAAVIGIAVVLRVTLARHMLRSSVAVLADGLGVVTSARAREMALHAARRRVVVPAVAVAVTRYTAGRTGMGQTIRNTMTVLAAGSRFMLAAVAIVMTLRTADSRRMVAAVTVIVASHVAVCQIVALLITAVVSRQTTGRIAVLKAVRHTVTRHATCRGSVAVAVVADKMLLGTAGRGRMVLAVAGIVPVNLAFRAAMIHTIAVGMTVYPARSCPVMVQAVAHIVPFDIARRRFALLSSFCIRQHGGAHQHAQRQQHSQQLFHFLFLLVHPFYSRLVLYSLYVFC